ncbi:MAG: hypothetical protein ACE5FY_03220 [Nitrospiria bacterium]
MVDQGEGLGNSSAYPKASVLNRFIAKFVDFLVASAISQIPFPSGVLAALTYLLFVDGFFKGKGIGKRLIGLQPLIQAGGGNTSFKESTIRNFPLGIAYLLTQVPFVGWLIALVVIGFESLLVVGNPKGIRLGDELAGTQVIDIAEVNRLRRE